jgi:hypothetical protein
MRNEIVAELITEVREGKPPGARDMALKELGATGADGEKRAANERSQSKAEARKHKAALGEAHPSEKRPSLISAEPLIRLPAGRGS